MQNSVAAAAAAPQATPPIREIEAGGTGSTSYQASVNIEHRISGQPHKGKVFAAIQPHCDDIPIFAAGTVLKMIDEGYSGYLITMSDDSMAGEGTSYGDISLKNERDTVEVAKRLGIDPKSAKNRLALIVDRRNKIAHEADMDPSSPGSRWPIDELLVHDVIDTLEQIGVAIFEVVTTP